MWRRVSRHRPPAVDHDQARIRESVDWAITAAGKEAIAGRPARVTVADVQQRARNDFRMEITEATAREALQGRLRLRGTLGLTTDAWD